MFRSIKWRLPFSYAAIALIAAVALGIVLITTLREFYAREELDYLMGNARVMGEMVGDMLSSQASPEALQSELIISRFCPGPVARPRSSRSTTSLFQCDEHGRCPDDDRTLSTFPGQREPDRFCTSTLRPLLAVR
jgi:hypothetical protein